MSGMKLQLMVTQASLNMSAADTAAELAGASGDFERLSKAQEEADRWKAIWEVLRAKQINGGEE